MLQKNAIYEALVTDYTAEGLGVARVEGVVVAIGAAAGAHRAVPVGAGEACVYH